MASQEYSITGTEKGQRLAKATYPTYNRNRLPTLQEVLSRKTAPPVCLYNFYLYMRDSAFASDYLDFYLDVLEHEVICKAYVKDLKKQGLDVNIEYPEYERFRPGGLKPEKYDPSRQSITASNDGVRRQLSNSSRGSNSTSVTGSGIYEPSSRPVSPFASNPQHVIDISAGSKGPRGPGNRDSVRSSKTNNTAGNLSFYDRERPFTRDDLRESAERIYFKYIFRGSEKEIYLSDHIREKIAHAIEEESDTPYKRDDPWIYHEAKKEIFSLIENEYFPGFLKSRAFGSPTPRHVIHTRGALAAVGANATQNNHDQCDACGYGGRLMCCDSCPKAFHFTCLVPPLDVDNPPKGNWYCRECSSEKTSPSTPAQGPFQELIYKARCSNPKSFLLPDHIRYAFEDVGTGSHGEYIDLNKVKPEQRDRNGFLLEPDHTRILDENGKLVRCYSCKLPPSKTKPAMSCDYCDLHWHFDCLDPPLVIPAPANKRWMCPCHVDHALPPLRRLASENNLSSIDNTVIENPSQKKFQIDCDPEFYLNDALHKLPKNGVKLDYFGQMLRALQEEKEIEDEKRSIENSDNPSEEEVMQKSSDDLDGLHEGEKLDVKDLSSDISSNNGEETKEESRGVKRTNESMEFAESTSTKKTCQSEKEQEEFSCNVAASGESQRKNLFDGLLLATQIEKDDKDVQQNETAADSQKNDVAVSIGQRKQPPVELSSSHSEIEERLGIDEEVYKQNPLRLLMEVALVDMELSNIPLETALEMPSKGFTTPSTLGPKLRWWITCVKSCLTPSLMKD
ncbi:2580_t:CDS:2, partial [Acaulospora colombiana]